MTTMVQMKSLYNYNHSLYTLHQNEKKVRRLLVLLQSVSAIAILLLAVALFLLRRKRKKDRELLILSAEVRRMQKELLEYGSREERHLQEENRRSEETTASVREKPADDEVFSLELITGCSEHKEQLRLLRESEAVAKFRAAKANPFSLSDEEWKELEETVEHSFPLFRKRIWENPYLNISEKYLCLLYLSGFRPSDMELLLKRTSGYSALTKKRIARKLSKEL